MKVLRREDLRFLFLEALMILIGVLAALLLDSAREEAETRRGVRAARERLVLEVSQNRAELMDLEEAVSGRLSLLQQQRFGLQHGTSLADRMAEFGGFRTADFSDAAWDRLSRSYLGDSADPDLLRDAFYLYEWNAQFESLNGEINDLVFSEIFFTADKATVAIDISEWIMNQQLSWARELMVRYDDFLETHSEK